MFGFHRGAGLALATVLAVSTMLSGCGARNTASPADLIGDPVRVKTVEGDRVYILTSQWKTLMRVWRGSSGPIRTDMYIDAWAFDAATGKPLWRHRLQKDSKGVNMGRRIVGVDGLLWIIEPTGLVGLSLADGAVAADAAKIEAANPDLKGLLPREERYYVFDTGGLRFRAADGREWRLDGRTLKASAAGEPPATLAEGKAPPARTSGGVSTSYFLGQGVRLGDRWLGLMSQAGVAKAMDQGVGDGIDWETSPRMKVYSGRYGPVRRLVYQGLVDLKPLPESPEFLTPGLLNNGNPQRVPIMLFKPDSVLVLHADRLGDQARLRLTRVTGPSGKPAWTVDLPIQRLESVMPGEGSIVLTGSRPEPSADRGDKLPEDIDQLVAVDLTTGRATTYGFRIAATEEKDIPTSSVEPAKRD